MKYFSFVAIILFMLCFSGFPVQDQTRIPPEIAVAIKAGNAAELSKYMNSTVEILLLDKEDFYKKNVAEAILTDFFNTYQTRDFVISHQGGKNDAQYAIGNLKTAKGNFRVYFLLKKVDQQLLIHQIRINSENGK
jgi:hypothetical protein